MKLILSAVILMGFASGLEAKVKVKYICLNDGRYWVKNGNGPKRYCYDRKYYLESTMPPHVKEYFEEQSRRSAEIRAEIAEKRLVHERQMAERGVQPGTPGTTSTRSSLSQRPPAGRSAGVKYNTVEASTKPEPEALSRDLFRAIEPGTERDAVIAKLGEPHGRVAGDSSGAESWTYVVEGGAFAKVKIERGMVVKVSVP